MECNSSWISHILDDIIKWIEVQDDTTINTVKTKAQPFTTDSSIKQHQTSMYHTQCISSTLRERLRGFEECGKEGLKPKKRAAAYRPALALWWTRWRSLPAKALPSSVPERFAWGQSRIDEENLAQRTKVGKISRDHSLIPGSARTNNTSRLTLISKIHLVFLRPILIIVSLTELQIGGKKVLGAFTGFHAKCYNRTLKGIWATAPQWLTHHHTPYTNWEISCLKKIIWKRGALWRRQSSSWGRIALDFKPVLTMENQEFDRLDLCLRKRKALLLHQYHQGRIRTAEECTLHRVFMPQ